MDELISRKAAIDAIDKEQKEIDVSDVSAMYAYSKCKTIIKQLPSALSTDLAEVGTDCISRPAAIDAISRDPMGGLNYESILKELPTAEPKRETATVSFGKIRGGVTLWYKCDACGEPVDQEDAFCSRCGRELIHERRSNQPKGGE